MRVLGYSYCRQAAHTSDLTTTIRGKAAVNCHRARPLLLFYINRAQFNPRLPVLPTNILGIKSIGEARDRYL